MPGDERIIGPVRDPFHGNPPILTVTEHFNAFAATHPWVGSEVGAMHPFPNGGFLQQFQNASAFTPSELDTVFEVHGSILDKYNLVGGPPAFLGYPRTDETATMTVRGGSTILNTAQSFGTRQLALSRCMVLSATRGPGWAGKRASSATRYRMNSIVTAAAVATSRMGVSFGPPVTALKCSLKRSRSTCPPSHSAPAYLSEEMVFSQSTVTALRIFEGTFTTADFPPTIVSPLL